MMCFLGLIVICLSYAQTVQGIDCYRCNSTSHRECLEKFIRPFSLRPESCSDVSEARYCIKTTGIYAGEIGDQRFCSSKDLGNFCEYVQRDGDSREYRSCVYTCDTDGCNAAISTMNIPVAAVTITSITLFATSAVYQRLIGFFM